MISFLRGRVLEKHPNRLTVDVQGVGYDVHVPLSTYYRVAEPPGEVSLRVYTHVREDALQLYGFLTDLERQLFERLIGVSGIGPKMGVALLSGIPGIGKKTAERIVLELKDRVAQLGVEPEEAAAATSAGDRLRDDLLSALQNLGYHRPLAEKAADAALADGGEPTFEIALKAALRELLRSR